MKLYKVLLTTIILLFCFSPPTFAEDWGDEGRSVGEMLDSSESNDSQDNSNRTSEESPQQNEQPDEEMLENNQEQQNEAEELLPGSEDQSIVGLLFQMFLALAFIIFLIYALLKIVNKRSKFFRNHTTIESVGGVALGSNRSVQIVRVGDKLFVVGVGESINLLKEITDPDEVNKILEEHKPQELLDQPINKAGKWLKQRFTERSTSTEEDQSFQTFLNKELKGVKASQDKAHSVLKEKNDD